MFAKPGRRSVLSTRPGVMKEGASFQTSLKPARGGQTQSRKYDLLRERIYQDLAERYKS